MLKKGRKPRELSASPRVCKALGALAKRPSTAQKLALRARIIWSALDGQPSFEIAQSLGIHDNTVCKWRRRWAQAEDELLRLVSRLEPDATPCPLHKLAQAIGQEILSDAPRSGAPSPPA